jgi:PEP-CTERM motif-containing protein
MYRIRADREKPTAVITKLVARGTILGAVLAIAMAAAPSGQATPVGPSSTGLTAPSVVLNFSEVVLPTGTSVTNQYAQYGVTFSGLYYNPQQVTVNPTIVPPELGNFPYPAYPSPTTPFNIYFTNPVSAAVFAMYANRVSGGTIGQQGVSAFTALLNGVVQESFSAQNSQNRTDFYGFTNIIFDQITIAPGGYKSAALIDGLQFNPIPVPEPASLILLTVGITGVSLLRRRSVFSLGAR